MIRTCPATVLLLLICVIQAYARNSAVEKPNILFLFADDWRRYAGVYRDPDQPSISDIAQTPTIDELGRNGLVFRQAYRDRPLP